MAFAASATRYDIEKFDGTNDFGLWRIKMKTLMGNLGLKEALEPQKLLDICEASKCCRLALGRMARGNRWMATWQPAGRPHGNPL